MTTQVIDCPTHGLRLLARIDAERSLCLDCYVEARARYRATGVRPVWMKQPEPPVERHLVTMVSTAGFGLHARTFCMARIDGQDPEFKALTQDVDEATCLLCVSNYWVD